MELEMAMPVTEITAQQFSYFEFENAHTVRLRSICVLKDYMRAASEKKLINIAVVAVLTIFGPKASKTETPNNRIIASSVCVKVLSCSQIWLVVSNGSPKGKDS